MKILQISDLHGMEAGCKFNKPDPLDRLSKAVEHINHYHGDASFCAITGDIADSGTVVAYQTIKLILDDLIIPYYPIIGNHDLRRPFLKVFSNTPFENGFIQYRIDMAKYVFLFLDTVKENHGNGELCKQRMTWLENQIKTIDRRQPVVIFMHHPPFSIALPWMDSIMLDNGQAFYEIIKDQSVGYIFFGHIHRPAHGIWRQIPYASIRSVGHYQISPHNKQGRKFPVTEESPMYSVISFLDDQIHVDLMDFTNDKVVQKNSIF